MADLALALRIAGELLVTETQQETRLAVAAGSGTQRVAFSAVGDTCPLCQSLDGKVFEADSADARRFTPPLHINCDCIWTGVGDDEVGAQDRFTPRDEAALAEVIDQHGHFVRDPERYAPLRVPAGPHGRDFTFRRKRDTNGELVSEIEWHRPRYEVDGLDARVRQVGVTEVVEPPAELALRTLERAETVEQLEAWARRRWPRMAVGLAGGEVETLRETLAELDGLGRQYRAVEAMIPRVVVVEPFGLARPDAWAATGPDGSLKLNAWWFGDRAWFDQGWVEDRRQGGLPTTARQAVIAHEFGEVYRLWLERERRTLAETALGYCQNPTDVLGPNADTATERFAEAFAGLHLLSPDGWPAYLRELRALLRHELRVPY